MHCTCSVSNQGQRIGYKGDQWVGGANYNDTEVKQQYTKVGTSIILSENAVVQVGHS